MMAIWRSAPRNTKAGRWLRLAPQLLIISALVLLSSSSLAQSPRAENEGSPVPVIRVTGQAEISAEPDIATFEVGAQVRDPSSSKATMAVTKATDQLMAALREHNIPKENIETVRLALDHITEPISQQPDEPPSANARYRDVYLAAHILRVEVGRSRFNDLGEILDVAMQAGINFVGNVTFGIKDEASLQTEGLSRAVQNAREKADAMAAAANVRITGPLTLAEGAGFPRPMYETRVAMRAAEAPTPVPPSQIRRYACICHPLCSQIETSHLFLRDCACARIHLSYIVEDDQPH
jgi:uncharacterized protein YggE